jgi:protein O-mannosyl-transferase
MATHPSDRNTRQTLAICGLLLLAVALVFGQTVRHEFINADDDECVTENPQVTGGLTVQGLGWAFTNRLVGNWDPLTWISHMADWQLYGRSAGGHHLTNVLLHAATVLLLFLVLQQMTGHVWPSALAAAMFAIHPLRVESVAWVTERKDVLSGVFFMLTIWAYVGYVRHRSLARYLAMMALFAVGLMSKPMLATLPCVLLLLDYWPLGRMTNIAPRPVIGPGTATTNRSLTANTSRLVIEKLPLFVLVAACCAVTIWAQRVPEIEYGSFPWRIGNALISYVVYLRQFFCPTDLALLYPRRGPVLPPWQIFGAGMLLLGVTAAAFAWRRKCPYLLVGWLWYLGMMLPVIGLVPFGGQQEADRFTYLPQIGICIALVWGAADLCRSLPHRRWVCGVSSALVLAALMGSARRQTSYWRDSETLWTRTLACTSGNYKVHNLLGNALALRGRTDEAIVQFQKSLDIKPDFPEAHYSLGVAAAGRGRLDEAIVHYQKTLAVNPNHANAHNNLGNALLTYGRLDDAQTHFLEALRVRPRFAEAHYNLGNILFVCRRLDEAMTEYRTALEIRPGYAEARYNLGLALANRGQFDQAIAEYRKALEARPDFAEVYNSLGLALVACGRRDEAVTHYRKALEIRPDFAEARDNLGNVLPSPGH